MNALREFSFGEFSVCSNEEKTDPDAFSSPSGHFEGALREVWTFPLDCSSSSRTRVSEYVFSPFPSLSLLSPGPVR